MRRDELHSTKRVMRPMARVEVGDVAGCTCTRVDTPRPTVSSLHEVRAKVAAIEETSWVMVVRRLVENGC